MAWKLKCLLCNEYEDDDLVRIQEHAMDIHGYTEEDHRRAARERIGPDHYRWAMPDGLLWLDAEREP